MKLHQEIDAYLALVTGTSNAITPAPAGMLAGLPVHLVHAYDFCETVLFGRSLIVAVSTQKPRPSLAQLEKDRRILVARLNRDVALAFEDLQSYERRDLVKRQIPFIVPGRQLFLPTLLVDLRESFSRVAQSAPVFLSWVSQAILLKHLLDNQISGRALAGIAALLGYSPMAVTRAVEELVAAELCITHSQGRIKTIQFPPDPAALWTGALGRMRSPVRKKCFLRQPDSSLSSAFESGLTALSAKTTLVDNGTRTVALPHRNIGKMLSAGAVEICLYEEDAALVVEGWGYGPEKLSSGPAVDDLSLYLSLRDEPDDRVQTAAASLLERRKWL